MIHGKKREDAGADYSLRGDKNAGKYNVSSNFREAVNNVPGNYYFAFFISYGFNRGPEHERHISDTPRMASSHGKNSRNPGDNPWDIRGIILSVELSKAAKVI